MKQNVKRIVLSNRAKSTKSQVSDIEVFNKISIKHASLTFVQPIEIGINAHSLGNITSKFGVHTRNTDHVIVIQTRQVIKKTCIFKISHFLK